jgi:hypothetical protein
MMTSHKNESTKKDELGQLARKLQAKTARAEQVIEEIKFKNDKFTGTFRPLGMLIAEKVGALTLNEKELVDFDEAKTFLELGCAIADNIIGNTAISEDQITEVEKLAKKYLPDEGRGLDAASLQQNAGVFKKNADYLKVRMRLKEAKIQAIVGALVGMLVVATVVTALVAAGPTFGASLFLLLPLGLAGAGLGLPKALKSGLISSLLSSETQDTALNLGPTAGEQLQGLKQGLDAMKQGGRSSDTPEPEQDPNLSADL